MNIRYSDQALKDLRDFDKVERVLIAKKVEYLAENFNDLKESKKATELKGAKHSGQYRYIIARKIRALFRIEDGELILLILRVGKRKNIYDI
ncbi:MAG: type II toxin-antitoxin system RelE family toxin [Campylobacterales bacterium]